MALFADFVLELLTLSKLMRAQHYIFLAAYPVSEYLYYSHRLDFAQVKKKIVQLDETDCISTNNGSIVYITGKAFGSQPLTDPQITPAISLPKDSISLIRNTETCIRDVVGKLIWKRSKQEFSSPIRVGSFQLSDSLAQELKKNLAFSQYQDLPSKIQFGNKIYGLVTLSAEGYTRTYDGWFYKDANTGIPGSPSEGDVRLCNEYVPPGVPVSIVAKQDGNILKPFEHPDIRSGIAPGVVSVENLGDTTQRSLLKWFRYGMVIWPTICSMEVGTPGLRNVTVVVAGSCLGVRIYFMATTGKILIPTLSGADDLQAVWNKT